jgi:hypothetical protein
MERPGPAARAVAAASMTGGRVELLGGAIEVKIVRPPSLLATMSGTDGGEVRYQPAVVEVSGDGFETARLDTAGDNVELRLDEDGKPDTGQGGADDSTLQRDTAMSGVGQPPTDPASAGQPSAGQGGGGQDTDGGPARSEIDALKLAEPLPLPSIPGVPPLATEPGTEAAPAPRPGTSVRISLGDVRQAVLGHAIAAKATAVRIAITQGPNTQPYGRGVLLDVDMGLLEVAAVAPEPASVASGAVSGKAGGLPITGPRVDVMALTGVALLIAGAAALVIGMRGRRH